MRSLSWTLILPSVIFGLQTEAPFLDLRSQGQGIYGLRSLNAYSYQDLQRAGNLNQILEFDPQTLDLGLGAQPLLGLNSWRPGSRIVLGNEVGDPLWRETLPGEQTNNRTPTMQLMGQFHLYGAKFNLGLEQIDHFQSLSQARHMSYGDQVGIIGDDWSWQGENYSSHSMGYVGVQLGDTIQQNLQLGYREGWLWLPHPSDNLEDPIYLRLAQGALSLNSMGLKVLPKIWQESRLGTRLESWGLQNSILQSIAHGQVELHSWDWQGSTRLHSQWGSYHWAALQQTWQNSLFQIQGRYWMSHQGQQGGAFTLQNQGPIYGGLEAKWNRNSPLHAYSSPWAVEYTPFITLEPKLPVQLKISQKFNAALNLDQGIYGQKPEVLGSTLWSSRSILQISDSNPLWNFNAQGFYEWRRGDWHLLAEQSPSWSFAFHLGLVLPEDLEIGFETMAQGPSQYRLSLDSTWSSGQSLEPSLSIKQYWLDRSLVAYAALINMNAKDQYLHPWGAENRFRILVQLQYLGW